MLRIVVNCSCSATSFALFLYHVTEKFFISCVCAPTETVGMQRLNTMVSSLVLRRTKADLNPDHLCLTKKIVIQHSIKLSEDEMAIHRYMFIEAK